MSEPLKTRNVFIDTQVFRSRNFYFGGAAFTGLIKLADKGRVTVYLVDITQREIKTQIEELLEEAKLRFQDFKKKASILFSVEKFRAAFKDFDGEKQGEEVWGGVEKFIADAKVKVIPGKIASIERVFESYFGRKAPFGGGAKKSEFPDAFVIDTLAQWCATSDEMMYVVSGDGDFEKACSSHDKLIHLKDIQEFVALVLEAAICGSTRSAKPFTSKGFWFHLRFRSCSILPTRGFSTFMNSV